MRERPDSEPAQVLLAQLELVAGDLVDESLVDWLKQDNCGVRNFLEIGGLGPEHFDGGKLEALWLRGGLRDVVDFRDLFRHFVDTHADFEQRLLRRAEEFGCVRALFYAVTTAQRLVGLAPSAAFCADLQGYAPSAPVRSLMGWLIDRLLAPQRPDTTSAALAERLLFIRSHWIRMPPGMLLRHLAHKWVKGRKPPPVATTDLPG